MSAHVVRADQLILILERAYRSNVEAESLLRFNKQNALALVHSDNARDLIGEALRLLRTDIYKSQQAR